MKQHIYNYIFGVLLFMACTTLILSCNNESDAEQETISWDTTAAFFKDSTVDMDENNSPKAYVSDEDYILVEYPSYFIPSGYYHGDEVTDAMTKADWFSLYKQDDEFLLEQATVKFQRIHDDMVDDNPEDKTGWEVLSAHEGEFFIGKVANLQAGAVEQVALDTNIVLPGESKYFDFGGVHYRLYASAYSYKEDNVDFTSIRNYKLYLEKNENGKITTQLIVATPYYMDNYSICNILFAGDIDKDNKPDIIINTSNHYNSFMPTLFLSGSAGNDELLKVVALHVSVGC